MYKKYLIHKLFFIVVLLVCLGLINLIIDPYALFGFINQPGFNAVKAAQYRSRKNWASMAIQAIFRGDYDTIFIGNSRTLCGMDPSHLIPAHNAYNASCSGANLENIYTVLSPILKKEETNITTILIGFDFGLERRKNQLSFDDFKPDGIWNGLFGIYTLKDSAITLGHNVCMDQNAPVYLPNGFRINKTSIKSYPEYKMHLERMIKDYGRLSKVPLAQGYGWQYLKSLVAQCNAGKINLFIFFPPIHADLLEGIDQIGMYEDLENWMRMVVRISYGDPEFSPKQSRVRVWNFMGYNRITTEPFPANGDNTTRKWYFEASHFKKEVGNMVLDTMLKSTKSPADMPDNLGTLLTLENIEAHLKQMRLDRSTYRKNK